MRKGTGVVTECVYAWNGRSPSVLWWQQRLSGANPHNAVIMGGGLALHSNRYSDIHDRFRVHNALVLCAEWDCV